MKIYRPEINEYQGIRTDTVFVPLPRGIMEGRGEDRLDLLHRLSTNAVKDLKPGEESATVLTSDKGRIIEVLRLLAFDDHILMITLDTDVERSRAWLEKYTIMDDFTTTDISDRYRSIGVYGEYARDIVARALGAEPPDTGAWVEGAEGVLVVRETRLNGVGAFLLLVPTESVEKVRQALSDAGAREIGSDTYQVLRTEAGLQESGHELTESYNPLEAGLVQLVSFTKGCYIGQEVIARLDTYDKVQRHIVGLRFEKEPEEGEGTEPPVVRDTEEGKPIGSVTSLAHSPELGGTIALAYVRTQYAIPDAPVVVAAGNENQETVSSARIVKLPFDL